MSLIYARISDREVLRDYQAVLGPGAAIAGPFAETLRSGGLSPEAVDWLKTTFFKTELELGTACGCHKRDHVSAISISAVPNSSPPRNTRHVCANGGGGNWN
jgi:hypothetical protein